jgi:hypothetical protein
VALPTKTLGGVTFKIDRPKGTTKDWPGGKSFTYPVDYGFVPRTKVPGDGEGLDAFVGDDPDGHLEVFQKLKGGRADEPKLLLGVSDRAREDIYRLYGLEVNARRVLRNWDQVRSVIDQYRPSRKGRYKQAVRANVYDQASPEGIRRAESRDFDALWERFKYGLARGAIFGSSQNVSSGDGKYNRGLEEDAYRENIDKGFDRAFPKNVETHRDAWESLPDAETPGGNA